MDTVRGLSRKTLRAQFGGQPFSMRGVRTVHQHLLEPPDSSHCENMRLSLGTATDQPKACGFGLRQRLRSERADSGGSQRPQLFPDNYALELPLGVPHRDELLTERCLAGVISTKPKHVLAAPGSKGHPGRVNPCGSLEVASFSRQHRLPHHVYRSVAGKP